LSSSWFFFSSRRRHTRSKRDWSSDVCSSDLFLVSPLSRTSLLLEDETGEQLAFGFLDDEVREIPLPPPAAPEEIKDFIRRFRALNPKPRLHTFEDITRWWLDHPNPLTYQQALGLSDELRSEERRVGEGCRRRGPEAGGGRHE